jgi:hypothetical protein
MKKYLRYSLPEWFERVDENTSTVMDKTRTQRFIKSQDDQHTPKYDTCQLSDIVIDVLKPCAVAMAAPNLISWITCTAEIARGTVKLLMCNQQGKSIYHTTYWYTSAKS